MVQISKRTCTVTLQNLLWKGSITLICEGRDCAAFSAESHTLSRSPRKVLCVGVRRFKGLVYRTLRHVPDPAEAISQHDFRFVIHQALISRLRELSRFRQPAIRRMLRNEAIRLLKYITPLQSLL